MKFELILTPSHSFTHLKSMVEMAELLVSRDTNLSITIIIIPFIAGRDYIAGLSSASNSRLRYIVISDEDEPISELTSFETHVENQVPKVKDAVGKLVEAYSTLPDSPRVVGLVLDIFSTSMLDVAKQFGLPPYIYCTPCAGILGVVSHIQMLYDENKYDVCESDYENSDAVLNVPSLSRPYPVKCIPDFFASKATLPMVVNLPRKVKEMKGILINTVAELEPYVLKYLSSGDTPVYPIGPLSHLNQVGDSKDEKQSDILRWLDDQPPSSVLFLCFGSKGGFSEEQAREIAVALERSGCRFLWSLRRASPNIFREHPSDFTNLEEVLPEGFFERTKDIGRVIGWAPQVAVLAKPAIGGFINQSGWYSFLESLWFGIPTAVWPLYAEQKFNTFMMVEEIGLAVEIKKYWRENHLMGTSKVTVTAEEIETSIKRLMDKDGDVRKKVKEMSKKCHLALMEGGSSWIAMGKFIEDVTKSYRFKE
ncbi:hypothetical protein CARUB_v10013590mg [Capsella rubella]|uniref:Glycosyltransferase n=1 Tax=Capsella rubella TaxID=81985 RepID=R0G517_9BRAS|nr:UDP-glycosyltransferase 71B7 [Capsella rubella]EOA30465.1 hypothetical protein CARUB_v10013590mg [Capsella rubella]EOA30466.1 hypothetical protein CARUB_v10013590mg [Capsella rubella]